MRLRLVKIEETRYLADQAKIDCGRYWTIYLYDADEYTYCCEMTPSHWLEAVFFETENRIEDALDCDLQCDLGESSHYRHVSTLKTFPSCAFNGDFETFDDAREHAQCNHCFIPDTKEATCPN